MATQDPYSKIDLINFNLKMLAKGQKRSLLISAGAMEDKQFLLEACQKIGLECHLQYHEPDRPKPVISRQQFVKRLLLE